ncbi:MAG TPA: aminotransferase class III-fold pyridoxal phosphate-dependent enzyme, partial [Candidatus Acidoferrales bacterium]|nr:aminotransferase class III-fold pyridoxal phosphate-dependent enzyme [Candidatus Acidoferrales bacterium]
MTRKIRRKDVPSKKISDAQILRDAEQYMVRAYRRPPIVFARGKGCRLYDTSGRAYLDFLGGIAVNALGYSHPRLVRVMRREAAKAVHFSNLFHNPFQGPLARKLAEWSGLDRVFFTNSGTEAMEGAMKLARAYSKKSRAVGAPAKTRFLALENSFHGRTFGAVSITYPAKYRDPFEPLVPGAEFVRFNDVADLERKFDDGVCAIVLETIQGEGGVYPVSESFWRRARELATKHDAAMITDEIQCGLGRTGRKFAYQKFATKPDVLTVAKPLAGGLPLGAFIANEKFAAAFTPGLHGTTFGGGPFVCAVALEFLKTLEDEKLLANVRE